MSQPRVAIFGASGLIGQSLALDLIQRGFPVRAFARRFTRSQCAALLGTAQIIQLGAVGPDLLADADVVINCIGVLQDGPNGNTNEVHGAFTARLSEFCGPGKLLIQLSVPGADTGSTAFSRSKRDAEMIIRQAKHPFVILRPGFVVGADAYGGSALLRALAMLPVRLPPREANAPFAAVAMSDLCETVNLIVSRWRSGETSWNETWELMEPHPRKVCDVLDAFRTYEGGPRPIFTLPGWMLTWSAWAGDITSWLGWKPPIRSTALSEMRRGVTGDPTAWMRASGITPRAAVPGPALTIQEAWFSRLYLLKAVALVTLVIFWCASGIIPLTMAFFPARAILIKHGFDPAAAQQITIAGSVADIAIGLAIAWRPAARFGLIVGIALSLFYMVAAAILAPDLWSEPLGALVKTGPAIILMAACLAILDDRP